MLFFVLGVVSFTDRVGDVLGGKKHRAESNDVVEVECWRENLRLHQQLVAKRPLALYGECGHDVAVCGKVVDNHVADAPVVREHVCCSFSKERAKPEVHSGVAADGVRV